MTHGSLEHISNAVKGTADQMLKATSDALTKRGNGAEHIAATGKANVEALSKSGASAINGFQELTKAYQALATRNAEKLSASIQAFSTVKTPAEFVELQQKLIADSIEASANDWSNIAKLTIAVFSSAFEPMQKQIETLQKAVNK